MSVQSQDVFAAAGVPLTVIGSGGGGTPTEDPMFSTIKVAGNGEFGSIGTIGAPVSTIVVGAAAVSSISVSSINGSVPGTNLPNLTVSTLTANSTFTSVLSVSSINIQNVPGAASGIFMGGGFTLTNDAALSTTYIFGGSTAGTAQIELPFNNLRLYASTLMDLNSDGAITMVSDGRTDISAVGNLNLTGSNVNAFGKLTTNNGLDALGSSFINSLAPSSFGATPPASVVSTATQNTIVLAGYRFTWLIVPVNMSAGYAIPPAATFFSSSVVLANQFSSPPYTFTSLTSGLIPVSTISFNYLEATPRGGTNVSTIDLIGSVELGQNIQTLTNFQVLVIGPA
jgi:hypothetical protein